jgi:hypothetical protein
MKGMLGMLRYTDAGSVGAGYLADALLAGGQWVLNLPGQRLNTKGDPIDAFYYMIYIYIINLFSDIPIIYQHLSLLWFMFHPFF